MPGINRHPEPAEGSRLRHESGKNEIPRQARDDGVRGAQTEESVTDRTRFHVGPQQADALLAPMAATIRDLQARTAHYLDRVALASDADAAALREASEALVQAAARIAAAATMSADPGDAPDEQRRKKILITGAGGRIGRDLATRLAERFDVRAMYHRSVPDNPPSDDWLTADTGALEAVLPAMAGVDAVVHLAGEPSPSAPWEEVLEANIVGTRNVFEAARLAGVKRVVFASTNHVMGMYDRDRAWPVYADQPVRPDSLYGVSKAFGEALGRYYADQHGLDVVCLRIGWWQPEPADAISRWMWLSPRDCEQVVRRAIEADIRYGVFYAISGNAARHWDITDTIQILGYRPQDDAEHRMAEIADGAANTNL